MNLLHDCTSNNTSQSTVQNWHWYFRSVSTKLIRTSEVYLHHNLTLCIHTDVKGLLSVFDEIGVSGVWSGSARGRRLFHPSLPFSITYSVRAKKSVWPLQNLIAKLHISEQTTERKNKKHTYPACRSRSFSISVNPTTSLSSGFDRPQSLPVGARGISPVVLALRCTMYSSLMLGKIKTTPTKKW